MRTTLLLIITLFSSTWLSAQEGVGEKAGASLKLFLSAEVKDPRFLFNRNGQDWVPVFIELNNNAENNSLSKSGIQIRTLAGNIATADVPLRALQQIIGHPAIKKVDLPLLFVKTDTLMRKLVTADRILNGDKPLGRGYTGKNCVIGIIDDGIDISHPDFLDSLGNTRVKAMWNMDMSGTPPAGFGYGHEWNSDSLQSFIGPFKRKAISIYDMQRKFGYAFHGTSVTGLAAGNSGIATGADIVSVALTAFADTLLRSDRIIDAIAYIYLKAKSLDKKCVINISLGLQDGAPHDGLSMVERAIDAFCDKKPDIIVNVSAGNNGNSWKHWGALPIHKDSSFGFFRCAYESRIYFLVPRKNSDSIFVSLTDSKLGSINAPAISRDSIIAQTPYFKIGDLVNSAAPIRYQTFFKNGFPSSTLTFSAAHASPEWDEIIINVQEHSSSSSGIIFDDHLYRFIFKGSGIVHGWFPFWNLHPIYFFGMTPYPDDSTFITTDNAYSTNIPSHAFTVLSSGAYNARECYLSTIHNEAVHTYPGCQLTYFTSHGPTLDGRIKPDIIAPGENVISPRSRYDDFMGHQFIIDSSWLSFSGTSASSPITAGICALLWEYNPEYSRDDIIHRIKSTAYSDHFTETTGPLPNNISGWGKIDAFKAMTNEGTDMVKICSIRELCEAKYIEPPPNPGDPDFFYLKLYPNPVQGTVYVNYRSAKHLQLAIYTATGQLVFQTPLFSNVTGIIRTINLSGLKSGVYFVRAVGDGISVSKKLLVSH